MKIVLVNLPWRHFNRTGVRAGSRWPHIKGRAESDYIPFPFFLAYAAALLKKHNFAVTLIDAVAQDMFYKYCLRLIEREKPDLLVCETSTVTLQHDLRLLQEIKKNFPIVLCGPDVNIRKPEFLETAGFIDYVISGEYELTLLDLATKLRDGKQLKGSPGLIYRENSKIVVNPDRPLADLDALPWPLRDSALIKNYNDSPGDMPLPSVQMLASRGCPYHCKFCLWPQVMYRSNSYRVRNIVDVVNEMEYLVREMHFKSVYFDDDTFNCGKERMLKLSAEIKARKLNVPWAIMARADLMDEEVLTRMREAGLFAVKYGVESATQELLDQASKNMDLEQTIAAIKITKKMGIKTHLTFTFGIPGETRRSIEKTISLALALDPETVQFSIATPFPGTKFYTEAKQNGEIVSENWLEYDGNRHSVIEYKNIKRNELKRAVKLAYRRWAEHCAQRRRYKGSGYYRLFLSSLKKNGLYTTCRKGLGSLFCSFSEKVSSAEELEKKAGETGLRAGRMMMLSGNGGLRLYWDGEELTRSSGFSSAINLPSAKSPAAALNRWEVKKVSESELLLCRAHSYLPGEEIWRIKVVDEKQIDWEVEISLKDKIETLAGKIMLILSSRYRTWVDCWGEGRFYPLNDYRKIRLRNPGSEVIGVRGRKKLKGELPTIFLDLSRNEGECLPSIQNARSTLGARVLAAQTKISNGHSREFPDTHKLFSVRIKIVEEDFRKRKANK